MQLTGTPFHEDIVRVALLGGAVQRHDVGMGEGAKQLHLLHETLLGTIVLLQFLGLQTRPTHTHKKRQ